jgi:hypothetical protein
MLYKKSFEHSGAYLWNAGCDMPVECFKVEFRMSYQFHKHDNRIAVCNAFKLPEPFPANAQLTVSRLGITG